MNDTKQLPKLSEAKARELQTKGKPWFRALVTGPRRQWQGTNGIRYRLVHAKREEHQERQP